MEMPQRGKLDAKSRENSLEISQHEIVPRVPHRVSVHLHDAHARHRVDHVVVDSTSGHVDESLHGAQQPVESVFVVVLDPLELSLVRERLIDGE